MGVDPANFSWALMDNAASVAKDNAPDLSPFIAPSGYNDILDAKQILSGAFENLIKSGKVKAGSLIFLCLFLYELVSIIYIIFLDSIGSSTACILSLSKSSGILNAATLGDSAYILIRNG